MKNQGSRPTSIAVGVLQAEPGSGVREEELAHFADSGAKLLVFPEYFWVKPGSNGGTNREHDYRDAGEALAALTRDRDWVIVGGTVPEPVHEGWHNTCLVYQHGRELARYRKINLMRGERKAGAIPGQALAVVEALGLRLAPVVCADVLDWSTFDGIAALNVDLILAPMASPLLPDDTEEDKENRDRNIFATGAIRARAPIVKVCGIGSVNGKQLQGRTLVATPDGIIYRTGFEEESVRYARVIEVPISDKSPA
jgi:predicted amidohydrolase